MRPVDVATAAVPAIVAARSTDGSARVVSTNSARSTATAIQRHRMRTRVSNGAATAIRNATF